MSDSTNLKKPLVEGVTPEVERIVEQIVAKGPPAEPPTYDEARTRLRSKLSQVFPELDDVFKAELFSIKEFPPIEGNLYTPLTANQRHTVYEFFKVHPILLTYVPSDEIVKNLYRMLAWIFYNQDGYAAMQFLDAEKEYSNFHRSLRQEYDSVKSLEEEGKSSEEILNQRDETYIEISRLYNRWTEELKKDQEARKEERLEQQIESLEDKAVELDSKQEALVEKSDDINTKRIEIQQQLDHVNGQQLDLNKEAFNLGAELETDAADPDNDDLIYESEQKILDVQSKKVELDSEQLLLEAEQASLDKTELELDEEFQKVTDESIQAQEKVEKLADDLEKDDDKNGALHEIKTRSKVGKDTQKKLDPKKQEAIAKAIGKENGASA